MTNFTDILAILGPINVNPTLQMYYLKPSYNTNTNKLELSYQQVQITNGENKNLINKSVVSFINQPLNQQTGGKTVATIFSLLIVGIKYI
jgi:hypothetical protein